MRTIVKAARLLGAAALAAPACTSILGDFEVTGGAGGGGPTSSSRR